tara:strand:- start:4 stop:195 length:192 start_codon:yes stop_codon:yes gene_type:complete
MTEHGNVGNKNAVKLIKKSSILTLRCEPNDKAQWTNAAKETPLQLWVINTLNTAATSKRKNLK